MFPAMLEARWNETCPHCNRVGMTVYGRIGSDGFGCAACLGEFFEQLHPTRRPYRMSFWGDVKSLFGRQ
jgi:hypothetical protein